MHRTLIWPRSGHTCGCRGNPGNGAKSTAGFFAGFSVDSSSLDISLHDTWLAQIWESPRHEQIKMAFANSVRLYRENPTPKLMTSYWRSMDIASFTYTCVLESFSFNCFSTDIAWIITGWTWLERWDLGKFNGNIDLFIGSVQNNYERGEVDTKHSPAFFS